MSENEQMTLQSLKDALDVLDVKNFTLKLRNGWWVSKMELPDSYVRGIAENAGDAVYNMLREVRPGDL
jgi:hypothetical protein